MKEESSINYCVIINMYFLSNPVDVLWKDDLNAYKGKSRVWVILDPTSGIMPPFSW